MAKHKPVIHIANPLFGGSKYTTLRRANKLVANNRAVFVSSTEILFTHRHQAAWQMAAVKAELNSKYDDKLVSERAGGQLPWNGADTRDNAFHLPFTSSVYRRVSQRIPVLNDMIP